MGGLEENMAQVRESAVPAVEAEEVSGRWRDLLDRVVGEKQRLIVEERGRAVAAIIPVQELDRLRYLEAERRRAFEPLEKTRAKFADVPPEEIEREVARAIAEVRRANRRRRTEPGSA
jgi:PHD/YefM family antitoxin component YafN of YafNO toxin-antitoxin module